MSEKMECGHHVSHEVGMTGFDSNNIKVDAEYCEVCAEIDALKERIAELEAELDELKPLIFKELPIPQDDGTVKAGVLWHDEYQKLKAENERLREDLRVAKKEAQHNNSMFAKSDVDNVKKSEQIKALKKENERLREGFDKLKTGLEVKRKKTQSLKAELEEAQEDLSVARMLHKSADEGREQHRNMWKTLKAQLAERDDVVAYARMLSDRVAIFLDQPDRGNQHDLVAHMKRRMDKLNTVMARITPKTEGSDDGKHMR